MTRNNTIVADNYNRRAAEYDQMSRTAAPWVYFDRPFVSKIVLPAIRKGMQIADLGCGAGKAIDLLVKGGVPEKNIFGVDISKGLIDIAQKNHPAATFKVGDFTRARLPEKKFDAALSIRSTEYLDVKGLEKFFKNAFQSLKKGGRLFLVTGHPLRVNDNDASTYLERGPRSVSLPWGMKVDLYHKTLSDFVMAATRAGFLIELMDEPPIPAAMKRDDPETFAHEKKFGAVNLHVILRKSRV